jgi:GTP-binding protein YchF
MSLQCGIVGLPNVGKSTLFNALTKAGIAAENYPFCTIEPNVGIVEVPDPRLAKLAAIAKPQKVIPAVVEFVDIAGLVAGASKGEGLGNQFLANIRETNAIANVVRCFNDPNVVHVANKVDPIADIEVIHTELALADMQTGGEGDPALWPQRARGREGCREARRHPREVEKALDGSHPVRSLGFNAEEMALLQPLQLSREARAVHRERGRARIREQSAAGSRARVRAKEGRAGRRHLREARGRDRRPHGRGEGALPRRHGE